MLVASACGATPFLAGRYEGERRPQETIAQAEPERPWRPAELDLRADASCWWFPGTYVGPDLKGGWLWTSHMTPPIPILRGCWRVESPTPGVAVLTVVPDEHDPSRFLTFDVTTADGQTVLVAKDGSRLTRAR